MESDRSLAELVDGIPVGWSRVVVDGRAYGLSRVDRVGGRVVTIQADELGGPDGFGANVWRTRHGDELRPCEVPAERVLGFLAAVSGR